MCINGIVGWRVAYKNRRQFHYTIDQKEAVVVFFLFSLPSCQNEYINDKWSQFACPPLCYLHTSRRPVRNLTRDLTWLCASYSYSRASVYNASHNFIIKLIDVLFLMPPTTYTTQSNWWQRHSRGYVWRRFIKIWPIKLIKDKSFLCVICTSLVCFFLN